MDARGAVERVFREESGRVIAGLIRYFGGAAAPPGNRGATAFQLAEDVLQEALLQALVSWQADGIPENPAAWVTRVSKNRAIDRLRRERTRQRYLRELKGASEQEPRTSPALELEAQDAEATDSSDEFPDERLRLFFTCCHPALDSSAQIALTLRTLAGLTTSQIARAFLVTEQAMAQRLVRAQRKISVAGIPYEVPARDQLAPRVQAVLKVVYLIFNEGYLASSGGSLMRAELCEEAIRLARILSSLLPEVAEVRGVLALMLLTHARRDARSAEGELVLLEDQDRSLWDRRAIAEGLELLDQTLRAGGIGPFQVQAAVAALHARAARASETDWAQIAGLYTVLLRLQPSPIVELNRAVAISKADGAAAGFPLVQQLEQSGRLSGYYLLPAVLGHLHAQLERPSEAEAAFKRALELCANAEERRFLERQLGRLRAPA